MIRTVSSYARLDHSIWSSGCHPYRYGGHHLQEQLDGNLLILEAVEGCSGYAEFQIEVSEPVVVTYTASRICGGNPSVDPPLDRSAPFERLDCPLYSSTWSGPSPPNEGLQYWFLGFDGRFCFDCCGATSTKTNSGFQRPPSAFVSLGLFRRW